MKNFMKPIINAIKYWTNSRIEESKAELNERISNSKADWNQNNPEADNYVKNRTHWEEESEIVSVPETTLNFTAIGPGGFQKLNDFDIIVGKTYIVTYDSIDYECVAYIAAGPDIPSIGDGAIADAGNDGSNGEPFFITNFGGTIMGVNTIGTHTIKIVQKVTTVHPLDTKFLPDGIGVQSDWNENDENSKAYIKNKPFESVGTVYIEEQEITFEENGYATVSMNERCPSGEQCKAIFDGVEYTGTVEWWETDAAFQFTLSDGTVVTITWWDVSAQIYSDKYEDWANTTHTIKFVSLDKANIKKIDSKFLPDNIATIVDIEEVRDKMENTVNAINTVQITVDGKMDAENPIGTGVFSMNRTDNSEIGEYSSAIGLGTIADCAHQSTIGIYNCPSPTKYAVDISTTQGVTHFSKNFYYSDEYTFDANSGYFTLVNAMKFSSRNEVIGKYTLHSGSPDYSINNMLLITGIYTHGSGDSVLYRQYKSAPQTTEKGAYVHVIGNGTSDDSRSNAHTLDWNGNAWYAGDVYTGSTSGTNKDEGSKKLATEEYVDSAVAEAAIEETDPTVPDWAKQPEKPTYTPDEIGAQPAGSYLTEDDLSGYATENFVAAKIAEAELSGGDVDLSGYATKDDIPTKTSQLTNDSGFLTKHQDLTDYAKKTDIPDVPVQSVNGKTGAVSLGASDVGALPNTTVIPTVPTKVSAFTNDAGYLTEHQSLAAYAKTADLGDLATKDTVSKTDLTTDVQASLGKADTALQSYTETDPTVPAWAKATTKPTYTASEVGALPSTTKIPSKLSDLTGDSTHRTVTDTEKSTWSAKVDTSSLTAAVNDAFLQAKASGEFDGESVTVSSVSESQEDGGSNIVTFSDGKTLTVNNGNRGSSIYRVTTAPSSYTTATGGFTPKYRIALSTVLSQSGATEVRVGDTILRNYYTYPVGYVDADYVYVGAYASIRGTAGTSVTVESVSESAADGGENVVTFSNSTTLTVKNGSKGSTPVKGVDYWTSADRTEMLNELMESMRYVTPQMFGAKADGVTNDTAAINAAIEAVGNGGTVFFPDGAYLVKETETTVNNDRYAILVNGKENLTLLFSSEAVIQHATSSSAFYRTILIKNSNEITVKGGTLIGDLDTHTPEYKDGYDGMINTHGYGIRMIDSTNLVIDGVELLKYYGDPLIICSEQNPYNGCQNVVIKNCRIHDSARNGITVTSCQGLLVKNCEIYNITGAMPMAGIDIEGEYEGAVNEDITLDGCNILNNGYQSIAVQLVSNNVTIKNCRFDNLSMGDNAKNLVISDCIVEDYINACSNLLIKNSKINGLLPTNAKDISVIGCVFTPKDNNTSNVNFQQTASDTVRFIGCEFMSPKVQDKLFLNIRTSIGCNHLSFSNCTFHIDRSQNGDPIGTLANKLELMTCTFVDNNESYTYQWLALNAVERLVVNSCIFDASNLTNYNSSSFSSLVKIIAPNIIVQNCIIKTANTPPSTYGFHSQGDAVTGEVYYLNNTLPMYDSLRLPTTASRLVVRGNILSTDEIDTASLPSAEEASF